MAPTTLDLVLAPEAAPRLFRHAAIAARPRTAAVEQVFYASEDGRLAKAGLAVVVEKRRRGAVQRLVSSMPERDGAWCPGAPAPVLAETLLPDLHPDLAALAAALPADDGRREAIGDAPAPRGLAAFSGRAATATAGRHGVAVTLLSGSLRAVASERAVARVALSGEREAVFRLAAALAADLPLSVPATSLAEEARALSLGVAPRPLAAGAPSIAGAAGSGEAFAAIVSHLTLAMLAQAPAAQAGETPHGVHQMRVALRRLRSALSLFRDLAGPEGKAASAGLKALAGALGPARDWDVFITGRLAEVGCAFAADARISGLASAAEAVRDAAYAALRERLSAPAFRLLGLELAALASTPRDATEPAEAFARRALTRRLKRLLRHGEDLAALPVPTLHAVRLDAKRLRYAGEMFAPLFGQKRTRRFLAALAEVQEQLGHLNDAAVAAGLLAALDDGGPDRAFAIGVVEGWIAAMASGARAAAFEAWDRFLSREVFWDG